MSTTYRLETVSATAHEVRYTASTLAAWDFARATISSLTYDTRVIIDMNTGKVLMLWDKQAMLHAEGNFLQSMMQGQG